MKTQNAIIKSVDLTKADHNLLSAWLHLEFGSGGQGFGGHALYLPNGFKHHKDGGNYAGHWLFRVMEIAGVDHWKDLPGKAIRVRHDVKGESCLGATIHSIGHITKNDWFDPVSEFEGLKS
jgi:hypothetical protein